MITGPNQAAKPSPWDIHIFSDRELPRATPERDQFIFLLNNLSDGVGDFVHGYDFAKRLRDLLHQKGYKLYGFIRVYHDPQDPTNAVNKRRDFVLLQLKQKDSPFDPYLVYDEVEDKTSIFDVDRQSTTKLKKQWCLEHQTELAFLNAHGVGGNCRKH